MQGGDITAILPAGLPNITASTSGLLRLNNDATGAFVAEEYGSCSATDSGYNGYKRLTFDASLSNRIYGASTTVQPPALSLLPQIKF